MPPPPAPPAASNNDEMPPSAGNTQSQLSADDYSNKAKPTRYIIGDLIWSKMTGHPWWPCMVTEDPLQKKYSKITGGFVF